MMLDEPYRWADAVANRREYIEDQLRGGSPVVGLAWRDGALLLTLGQGQQKIFEVYDRIGMAALGHPADIEKLRQSAVDLASVIGFNYSEQDVNLQQIVHFGLGPAVKTAFDEVFRSPFIVRVLMLELDVSKKGAVFYTVDYDGTFQKYEGRGVIGEVPEADGLMRSRLPENDRLSLRNALKAALEAWAAGRFVGTLDEVPRETSELERMAGEADLQAILKDALASATVEAVVLDRSGTDKRRFRVLGDREILPVIKPFR